MGDDMKKDVILLLVGCLIVTVVFSGCQEQQGATSGEQFEGVTLESNVVELVYASLEFQVHYEYIEEDDESLEVKDAAEVRYLFHNIVDRDITIHVTAEFYGKYDNLLYIGGPKSIFLFEDYAEQTYLPENMIPYKGAKVGEIDHVKIIAEEV